MKKGIDLAKWNKVTDYLSVRNAGVQFAIIKVINSQNKPDSRFHEHVSGMLGAGIPIIGGYTYSYANTADKARRAADAFVKTAGPQNITALWLDLEDNAVKGLGSNILNIINIYQSSAQDAGMHFGIYTGAAYYNPYLKPYATEIADIPIWWARYHKCELKRITPIKQLYETLHFGCSASGYVVTEISCIPYLQGQ